MQKIMYLSNTRDYTEQGNINENKYFSQINSFLDQGWKVAHIAQNVVEIRDDHYLKRGETFVAVVVLEKPDAEPKNNP